MTKLDFSNAQAGFDVSNLNNLIPDITQPFTETEALVQYTSVNGHLVTTTFNADDGTIEKVAVSFAGTDPENADLTITGIASLPAFDVVDGTPDDLERVASEIRDALLAGDTEVIAPIADFDLSVFSNFIELDSGIHFGGDTVWRGDFQNGSFSGNSEVDDLIGSAVYYGGSGDFVGLTTNFFGDAANVEEDARLFGGDDRIVLTETAPNAPSGFDLFINGDAFKVRDNGFAVGGDDFIDARLAIGLNSTNLSGDVQDVEDDAFMQGGDDTIFGALALENRIFGDAEDVEDNVTAVGGNDTLYGGDLADTIHGDWGSDNYDDTKVGGDDTLFGGAGNDELFGGGGDDTLYAGAGDDTLRGGDGDDIIFLSNGADRGFGGAGDDLIMMGTGAQAVEGGDGIDAISYFDVDADITFNFDDEGSGAATSDRFTDRQTHFGMEIYIGSDTGRDRVTSNADINDGGTFEMRTQGGNDVVNSFGESDTVDLGAGNDLVRANGTDGVFSGGSGLDTISYAASEEGVRINLQNNTASDGGAEGDVISGFERVNGSNLGRDSLTGTDRGNILKGLGGDDVLNGAGGTDKLFGGSGRDFLFGGSGNDQLFGGADSDFLFGGAGRDQVFGGSGADTFVFAVGDDVDIIRDFENNVDTILIDAGFGEDFNFKDVARQRDDGVLLDFGDGDFLLIEGALIGQLTNDLVVDFLDF